jgi:hypothetical protein
VTESSNISRWVAFLVSPLVLLISGFIALKAKTWFNLDVSPQDVAAYVFGLVLSLGAILTTWLHHSGKQELAKLTGLSEDKVEGIEALIEERLPKAPDAPTSRGWSPPSRS